MYFGGVSSGASFALKLQNEMPGEVAGMFSEVLAIDPAKDPDFDVGAGWILRFDWLGDRFCLIGGGAGRGWFGQPACGWVVW